MSKLNSIKFKKKNSILKNLIKETKESMIATNTFKVYFPERYDKVNLCYITDVVKTLGVFIIVDSDNNYCLINKPSMFTMEPSIIDVVTIDDVSFFCLTFYKDNKFMISKKTVKDASFVFTIFDEFMIRGNFPWYVMYEDILKLFTGSSKYAGSNILGNSIPIEALISILGKNKDNTKEYFRQVIKDPKDTSKLKFVALSNIFEGYNNTVSKLSGNYLKDGMISALVNPEEKQTEMEKVLLT